jgi:hypothetical protein
MMNWTMRLGSLRMKSVMTESEEEERVLGEVFFLAEKLSRTGQSTMTKSKSHIFIEKFRILHFT